MIEVQNLCKSYNGNMVVDNVSFRLPESKTLVLLGTSGSGKTTTLKMLNRLIEPTSGTIIIQGKDISHENPDVLRRRMGYVIQSIGLFPHLSIGDNIAVVLKLLHKREADIRERINFLLDLLNLGDIDPDKFPNELSGGQQQRVGLARALAADPDIILMDEPFGALDPITRMGIRKEFLQLEEIIRKTVVIVTHDVPEAWELGDIVCLMDAGKIIQMGTPHELTWNPVNNFVKDFIKPFRTQLKMMTVSLEQLGPKETTGFPKSMSVYEAFSELEMRDDSDEAMNLHQLFIEFKRL